jgi:hypothetical protein
MYIGRIPPPARENAKLFLLMETFAQRCRAAN